MKSQVIFLITLILLCSCSETKINANECNNFNNNPLFTELINTRYLYNISNFEIDCMEKTLTIQFKYQNECKNNNPIFEKILNYKQNISNMYCENDTLIVQFRR